MLSRDSSLLGTFFHAEIASFQYSTFFFFSSSVLAFLPCNVNRLCYTSDAWARCLQASVWAMRGMLNAGIHTPLRLAYFVPALPVQHGLFAAAVAADPWDPTSQHGALTRIVPAALRQGSLVPSVSRRSSDGDFASAQHG
jgi:hypothetical protein